MTPRPLFAGLLAALFLPAIGFAQKPKLEPGAAPPLIPTVTYSQDWPASHPPYYSIAVDSAGRGAYTAVDDKDQAGNPYILKFTVSHAVRERIFDDARALQYFNGQFDFTRHKVAFTGHKTLSYAGPERQFKTTFNWSQNPTLMSLTQLFIGIGNTIMGGRKLQYLHRFERLGLNDALQEMEELAKADYLAEVHIITPVLRQIADDPAVMEIARQRARRLLHLASSESAGSSATPPSQNGRKLPD